MRQRYRKSTGRPIDGSKPSYEPYANKYDTSSQYQRARSKSPQRDRQSRMADNTALQSHYGQVPLATSIPGTQQTVTATTAANGMAAMQHMLPQANPYASYYYQMAAATAAAAPPLPPTTQAGSTPVNPPLPTQPPPPLPPTPQQCVPYHQYYAQYMAAAGYPYAGYVPQQ